MELTKNDSKMLQGLSVLAMLCLHLFDRNYEGLFQPLIFFQGYPLCFYFGQLSDFCVFGFAFCSGYAHMLQYEQTNYYKSRLKGLLKLLCNYWIILIVFTIISILIGQKDFIPGNLKTFIMNATIINVSYNGAWWYLFAYAVLVLVSPAILNCVKRFHPIIIIGISFLIYCIAYYVRFNITTQNWLIAKLGPLGMTLFEYIIGCVCFKIKLFSKLYSIWKRIPSPARILLSVCLFFGMLYARTKIVPSLFVAPVTGFIIITLFHFWKKPKTIQKFFLYIGKHSTNIWLTHMFFYLVLFVDFVYIVKYPIAIFLLMLAVTLAVSITLQLIQKPIHKLFKRNNKEVSL